MILLFLAQISKSGLGHQWRRFESGRVEIAQARALSLMRSGCFVVAHRSSAAYFNRGCAPLACLRADDFQGGDVMSQEDVVVSVSG